MNKKVKVLVISHNPFSNVQNNGKTLESFFTGWDKENLSQIFIKERMLDSDFCSNYFKIDEKKIIKRFLNRKNTLKPYDRAILNSSRTRKKINIPRDLPILWWIRNYIWKIGKPWRYAELLDWINKFNPEIILFQTSDFSSFFDFALSIKKYTNAVLFLETTDEYLSIRYKWSLLDFLRVKSINRKYNEAVNNSKGIFVIGEDMLNEYQQKFSNGKYYIAMNCSNIQHNISPYHYNIKSKKITFLYCGNLGLNRWKELVKLGKCIESINEKNEIKSELKICSLSILSNKIKKEFDKINAINFIGRLNKEQVIDEMTKADILVHVESFDKKNISITRLSISTKVSEYIISNRCILAIGPKDVASIKYIDRYSFGCVIKDKNYVTWYDKIEKLINDYEYRNNFIKNAKEIAKDNHDYEKNINNIQRIILSGCEKYDKK